MPIFTDIEKKLLASITDDDLCSNLEAIHKAMKEIWAPDVPRIVQDYTDHGIKHTERVAVFASKLLKANDGSKISSQEMYLLLAGIYLHDIGMQCDVVRHPKIKAKAEELGAQFAIDFKSKKSNEYTTEEQKEIRKNHHYLSAAWIDYACKSGETVLGRAALEIPSDLVSDLMDVCKHHAKLPINDCPPTFRFDKTKRKQLVAALLRFSDELDIDRSRVSAIEAINSFNLDPQNKMYWWVHKCTKVIFSASNVVILTILLHPDDKKKYESLIYNTFILEFISKNRPVLLILSQNRIPISISADSKVEENEHATAFPEEIIKALALLQELDPVTELAEEVRTWLQAIRYEVNEPQYSNDRTTDMIATLNQGTIKQRVLVRCIEGEITPSDVGELDTSLDRKTPQGWLISDQRVANKAREKAADNNDIQIFNLADFLRQMVWRPYFDFLESTVEKSKISDLYVDISCYKQGIDENGSEIDKDQYSSLDAYIDDWLTERGKMHISLLGEFGTGKSWFCQHYAYRQLERYLKDPAHERLPLLITLRAFTKAMTAKQLINEALLEQYELPFVGSAFDVFYEMNQKGKLLLILDGFDEMARHVDYQTVLENFWELANLVTDSSKVILTSRTEYFRSAEESEKILGGKKYVKSTLDLRSPKFEVLYLEPFTDDQIREVITLRLGKEKGPAVSERILKTPNLAEMARKPVLVELLLAALDEVSDDVLETPAQVYLYATNKLLLRNIDTKRTFTKTADKLYFLCELAWEMIKSGELRIHYTGIPERIKNYFGERIEDQHELDNWAFDLSSQTLLHRNAAGYYEFSHKSLAEYFVAFKFAAELGCLAPDFLQTYSEAEGKSCDMLIEQKDVIGLAETFGEIALKDERMHAVSSLLLEMMRKNAVKRLWEVIDETRGKTFEQVKYAGGNAATLLGKMEKSFVNAKLASTVLTGAHLYDVDMTGADLQRACLRDTRLINMKFENSDFRFADFQGSEVNELYSTSNLAWSTSGLFLAYTINRSTLVISDVQNEREVLKVPNISYFGLDRVVQFVPNENCLLFTMENKLMSAILKNGKWNINTEKEFDYSIKCIAINSDGTLVAIEQQDRIVIWNHQTQSEYGIVDAEIDTHSLVFIPNSNNLVVAHSSQRLENGCGDAGFRVWDIRSGRTIHEYNNDKQMWSRRNFDTDRFGHTLLTTAFGGIPIIWALPTFDIIKEIPTSKFNTRACSFDGKTIVTQNYNYEGKKNGLELVFVDIATGRIKQLITTEPSTPISNLVFSPDGNYIAMASDYGPIDILDVNTASSNFGRSINILTKVSCHGMQVSGAKGLQQKVNTFEIDPSQNDTLLEFFMKRGAILDDGQKQILAEAQKIVPDTI